MPTLSDVPVELFLDNIFPLLPISALHNLGVVNRDFYKLTSDDTFWRRKIQSDYNFNGSETARTTGWKFIYKRLSNPKIYVWGETSRGRLGVARLPETSVPSGVPYPIRLKIPGIRIVSLVAGGMSFHALDVNGSIYVWGALDGSGYALESDGFSEPAKSTGVPMRLDLPAVFRSITCGRLHTAALDSTSSVWTFTSWGRPFKFISPLLDKSSPETTPVQVECGWGFTAILTQSSDVLVYWPSSGHMQQLVDAKNQELDKIGSAAKALADSTSTKHVKDISCYPWDIEGVHTFRLPAIPSWNLPTLQHASLSEKEVTKDTKLVRIAGLDNHLIGLTNKGHVLKYRGLESEETYEQGRWEYLPYFSELAKVTEDSLFSEDNDNRLEPPESMHITHISANFKTFIAYSTGPKSLVLIGNLDAEPNVAPQLPNVAHAPASLPKSRLRPTLPPNLQYQSVISVVLGDYHFGALTSTGKLLTWGSFANGALGLGDPVHDLDVGVPGGFRDKRLLDLARSGRFGNNGIPDVQNPSEVRFDRAEKRKGGKREHYVFGAAAAGWHTGALVIDLEPGDDSDDEEIEQNELPMPGAFPLDEPHHPPPNPGPYGGIPIIPIRGIRGRGMPHFRLGFAARGGLRGAGGQAGQGE